jgi:hypothetical protein
MTDQPGGSVEDEALKAGVTPLTPEEAARRKARSLATDDGDASHQGGAGAQGGQVDFGMPKNYS